MLQLVVQCNYSVNTVGGGTVATPEHYVKNSMTKDNAHYG